jgi:hypothetical protein
MEVLKQNKTLLIILAATVMIGAVYYFSRGDVVSVDGPLLESTYTVSPDASEVLSALSMLENFKLDISLFSDPAFLSLQDFTVPITPLDPGRRNPFEPLPGAEEEPQF